MFNLGESNLSLTDGINNNLDFFFNDFDNLFNEKITKVFIGKLAELTKEKINEKLKNALDYAEKIKDNEFKITFDENLNQDQKDEIGKKILELGEEQKKSENEIEEKYKTKINELKEEFRNKNIHSLDWVKNLKEKYSSDIDSSIYNFIGN
jgi:lysyl-tRNA synthetase class I